MTKRLDEIDILKSIGIILMIMGHIGFGGIFDYYIHAFHMPMFFIISGFLYKSSDLSSIEFIKRKAKSLLIPYSVFALFHYLLWLLIQIAKKSSEGGLLFPLKSIICINTEGMPIAGALWFLTALFFCECIYYFIDRIKYIKIKYLVISLLVILGYIIPFYFRLPFAMDISFIGVGLFEIGTLFRKKYQSYENIKIAMLCFTVGSVITFLNGYINMREGKYSNLLIFFIVSVLVTCTLFYLCRYVKNRYKNSIIDELMFIGRNSLVYVCLNQLVLLIPNKISIFIDNDFLLLGYKIIVLLTSLVILHLLVIFLNKECIKWILGK